MVRSEHEIQTDSYMYQTRHRSPFRFHLMVKDGFKRTCAYRALNLNIVNDFTLYVKKEGHDHAFTFECEQCQTSTVITTMPMTKTCIKIFICNKHTTCMYKSKSKTRVK